MKYKYKILTSRYGGEHVIGTIDKKVANYWLLQGQEKFEDYVFSHNWEEEKDELNKTVPKEFQIDEYWHDMDNIEHLNGVEYASSNMVYVHDVSEVPEDSFDQGKEVAEIPIEEISIGEMNDPVANAIDENPNGKIANGDEYVVYGQSFEKGGWDYETIETDKPFDISKLKVDVTIWDNLKIVTSFIYDGEYYCNDGGDTWGSEQNFWIDD